MIKKNRAAFHRRPFSNPDPNLYVPIGEHLRELMERDKLAIDEAKRLIEIQMRGYPEIFLTKDGYEKNHESIVLQVNGIKQVADELALKVEELRKKVENNTVTNFLTGLIGVIIGGATVGFISMIWKHLWP